MQRIFALIILTLGGGILCPGCAEKGKTVSTAETTDSPQGSTKRDASRAETKTASVPGTNFVAPQDDPKADGWLTEELSSQAGKVLKEIAHFFSGSDHAPSKPLTDLIDDEIQFTPLRPNHLSDSFQDASFLVRRADPLSEPKPLVGGQAFAKQVSSWLSFASSPTATHTKVKVFRVSSQPEQLEISAYMQTWGDCNEGTFQSNATWHCKWKVDAKHLKLTKLEVADYVEVVGQKSQAGGPMFADCTESVIGGLPTFQNQLRPSVDKWLNTIEIRFQINIGGWEGVSIADVNNDGLDDLYVCQPGGLPNRLFLQREDGTCQDVSSESRVDWLNESHGAVFADLDNDGDQDLAIAAHDGVVLMSNDGSGKFVTAAGMALPAAIPYSLSLVDYDVDGDLDIYVTCYDRRSGVNRHRLFAKAIPYHDANNGGRNVMLENRSTSNETSWDFRYVTNHIGLDENNRRFSYAGAWEDYDNDGDLDLYVANDFGRNNLYRNDGGTFKDVAAEAGVEDISAGMSACWGDYNNDGLMDIYVSNMFSSAGNRIAFQRKFQSKAETGTKKHFQRHARGNTLFENAGDGTFRDVSQQANVTLGRWAWGSRFLDLNNDGWQDLLVTNGFLTQSNTGDL